MIRDYKESDFEAVKSIHESTQIDYQFPDVAQPLFVVKKVLEVDGIVRAAVGAYVQVECYLWMDPTKWASPKEKMQYVKELDEELMRSSWLQGVDCAVLYLPPGMARFGKRLEALGWSRPRDGWCAYSKGTKQ